jgi:hypothetical protein
MLGFYNNQLSDRSILFLDVSERVDFLPNEWNEFNFDLYGLSITSTSCEFENEFCQKLFTIRKVDTDVNLDPCKF